MTLTEEAQNLARERRLEADAACQAQLNNAEQNMGLDNPQVGVKEPCLDYELDTTQQLAVGQLGVNPRSPRNNGTFTIFFCLDCSHYLTHYILFLSSSFLCRHCS